MLKKLFYFVAILVVLFVLAAIAIPLLFKGKITAMVKDEINNNLEAKVEFGSFGMSFFKQFPSLSLSLHDLSIVGTGDFENDTLASVQGIHVGVNFWTVLSGSGIAIKSILVDNPRIRVVVLENGKANYDIAKADTAVAGPGEPASFELKLKKYEIRNGWLSYDDRSMGFRMLIEGLGHEGSGDFTQDLFVLDTRTNADGSSLWYGGVKYLNQATTRIKAGLDMNMKEMKFTFNQNEIILNELVFGIDGWLAMSEENMHMDLKMNAAKNEFRNFLSLVPGVYSENFKDLAADGQLSLDAFVKGVYNDKQIPGFGLSLQVNNGSFRYPSLPAGVNNVAIDLKVNNPDGDPDHTVIDLANLHAEFGKEPVDARLLVKTPVSDPEVDLKLKGKLDLASIGQMVPLDEGTSLSGVLLADFFAKGHTSAVSRNQFDRFQAGGSASLTAFNYKSNEIAGGIVINTCKLTFNPKKVTLDDFDLRSGATDLHANGSLDNLVGYYFGNELLKGFLAISSEQVDLNPFMSESDPAAGQPSDTASPGVMQVPGNVDLVMTAAIGRVLYDDLVLTDVKGNLAIREKVLGLNDVGFGLLGGSVNMNGLYGTRDPEHPEINFSLAVKGMDVKKTFDNFVSVQKLAPIAGKCGGKYAASFNISGTLDNQMNPVYESLAGGGNLQTYGVTVNNFEPLVKVADALKMEKFRQATLSDANLSFKITNGRVFVEPYEQTIAGIDTRVEGSSGLDQTIDYTWAMKLPTKSLPSAATGMVQGLLSKANAAGANMKMSETVTVNVKIGGTVSRPVVKAGLGEMAGSAAAGVKAQVKEAIDAKKQELENQARAAADSLKQEAERRAKEETDRLKREAEQKAKAEADRIKKEAEEKAKKEVGKQLKNIFGQPK